MARTNASELTDPKTINAFQAFASANSAWGDTSQWCDNAPLE